MSRDSKFLSRVLRHEPKLAGLTLESGDWVPVDELLRSMKRTGHRLRADELHALVIDNDKRRFTLSGDGRRIRAAQGHSVSVDRDLPAARRPDELFHGTASASLDAIWAEGMVPGRRRHVHLSGVAETAIRIGRRHGRPVVLRIATGRMHDDGRSFWQAG